MMTQGVLPFKYEEERQGTGMTALAGLPLYLDMIHQVGLWEWIDRHVHVRGSQGWSDSQVISSLMLLNLAGGDCVDDLRVLESDEGFCRVLRRVEMHGMKRKERRALERRWRKERRRAVPSASSAFRYLEAFRDERQEGLRVPGEAFIPEPTEHLRGLVGVNKEAMSSLQRKNPKEVATLDMDATLVETHKGSALYSYRHFKAYQPLNTYWAEQGVVLHTEFRDGNVPAGYEQLRVFTEALGLLPEGVKEVRLRSDTAGYQHDLLKYCELGKNERFGRIQFAIGCDVTAQFKKAVLEVEKGQWHPIFKEVGGKLQKTKREWAEVCFVPNGICTSKEGYYRYLATREPLEQQPLPGLGGQLQLPFPTVSMDAVQYKVFGLVTNLDWDGEAVIHWLNGRCGKSEEVHSVMKEDLAGGKLPSDKFGANAAWWWMMVLALNLNEMMKRLVLGGDWVNKRLKAIRFHLINLPGRVIEHSRQLIVRLAKGHPSFCQFIDARRAIAGLLAMPSG